MPTVQALPASRGHALVCVNGECDEQTLKSATLFQHSLIVAVDGGARHAQRLNRAADWLIGDLDSIDPAVVLEFENDNTRVIRHPVEKNATDLELALLHVAELNIASVSLVGIAGGRLDHALANLLLLGRYDWPFSVEFFSTEGNGYLITPERQFERNIPEGTTLSLLPLTDDVKGVSTSGLYYPLEQATIGLGATLGISNVVADPAVNVWLSQGKLLLLISPQ